MGVFNLVRNGGQVVENVEELLTMVGTVLTENETLVTIVKQQSAFMERQSAVIVAIKDELGVIGRKMDKIQDEVIASKNTTDEIKHTKFYGQVTKLLPSAIERANKMAGSEIRELIHRAAMTHPGGRRKGYTEVYIKFQEVTGICLYKIGQVRLKASDGIDGWKKDPSYINTIFKKGKQTEVAVICMQMIADK